MDAIIVVTLLITTLLSFVSFFIVLSNFLKTGKNKVHFYVARDKDKTLWLYIGEPIKDEESESFVSNKCGAVICGWYEFGGEK